MTLPATVRWSWATLLLLVLAGCRGGPGADCLYAADCDEGLACFAGKCHELGTPAGTIAWEVLPPSSSGLSPASFPPAEGPLSFSICSSSVSGTLGVGGARLVASGEASSLPGLASRFERHVTGRFTMDLPAGAWTLTFHPDAPTAPGLAGPPPIARKVQLARCEHRELSQIVVSPPGTRTARLRLVVDPERDPRPACGAFVRIHDPASGAPLSSRLELRSSAGGACTIPAEISLAFAPPGGDEIELRIGPLDAVRPTVPEQRLRLPATGGDPLDFGSIGAGATALEQVLVSVTDGDGGSIAGAVVTAETQAPAEGDVPRFRSGPGRELLEGRYELWLAPGRYAFRAVPPEGAAAAAGGCVRTGPQSCDATFAVEAGQPASIALVLPSRLSLRGDAGAIPGGGLVEVRPARAGGGRAASGTFAEGGSWRLDLDPGDYDLTLRPFDPATPWLVQPLSAPLETDAREDTKFPDPALVIGTLWESEADETRPLSGALVRAWRLKAGSAPDLVGEAVSREDGSFSLVLPGN